MVTNDSNNQIISDKKIINPSLEYDDLKPGISTDEVRQGKNRMIQITLGVVLVVAGIAMLVLPGQGLLVIMVGLNLIKPDNAVVRWLRRKVPGIPEDGNVPKKIIALGIVLFIASGVASFIWGDEVFAWFKKLVGWGE